MGGFPGLSVQQVLIQSLSLAQSYVVCSGSEKARRQTANMSASGPERQSRDEADISRTGRDRRF